MNLTSVFSIAEICAQHGIKEVILSPGSRCAPLTLAFVRHPAIQVRTISDERAAAFIALGMALTKRQPVVLVCTSGTATLNFAPAVAEAFYQQVPLLVFTADRPAEWIDQLDGQTIRQENVYGAHVKQSFSFPVDTQHPDVEWFAERLLSEAILAAQAYPAGPVQINVPLREPFYPPPGEEIKFKKNAKVIREIASSFSLTENQSLELQQNLKKFSRILLVAGQQAWQPELQAALQTFAQQTGAVIVADVISNQQSLPGVINHHDVFLNGKATANGTGLQPDLLITFGLSNISKNLKLFLRAFSPQQHWHLQPAGKVADPFQSLTQIIRVTPFNFFSGMASGHDAPHPTYQQQWATQETAAKNYLNQFLNQEIFNEFTVFKRMLDQLPLNCLLHVANSMAVRYANIIGLEPNKNIEVFANRGTSGIDGCTSTTVGSALSTNKLTVLITGDLAFFYDRNGLWHNYLPTNLRIIILNNHAGGIFRLIDGSKQQPELAEFFETHQPLEAKLTAQEFNLAYYRCENLQQLATSLTTFWTGGPGILEICTQSLENAAFFELYRKQSPFKK
ncbi:2-succinyl-5-enolpyruvyl-6-hydroxy-3-cyclohexene-1-carboxylic-acid synthase [Adhaeribacter pallidiroseus]|uniref:2-succinyl-5-enolpyruvyl-6-hydroxy-3-cyclohexene-1-carboxylate synthase n=1 Tax=Adhaeribacter pallidiroseus TaxID=2072847 RepID=A0A369QH81_9BACT|nr:2-succinyl-5-enolpyruvyl-6-hydroxy-3-cyclohexene-1-carboxylic-acid synthase [Adhaeribacter pallidiroseus]RDC62576.1 2-succinyl-5-enolpyruvyl-6-hydroxy-3-cyclohexene-1-carboxylic-acidsynthase [Adhaeribacter pallidiroseus]